eukprot:Protomagalhaensia_wolfi_Nauph_80__1485@NODE_18_length_4932_cov_64_724709_g14_i0_p2_GENE_NODE_18_length_4932_cov_64_724709_g14_i0NODE_18_length_4932_cov_64_724709_g14_i0_p2_ORF_typecomplete_len253_score37_89_NODE_18_length_4932_cov_64_724709_g14_i039254683
MLWPALVGVVAALTFDAVGSVEAYNQAAFTPYHAANCDAPVCGLIRTFEDFTQCMEESTSGSCSGKLLVRIWGTADRESFCVTEMISEAAYWTLYVFPNVPFAHSPYFSGLPVHSGTMLTITLNDSAGEDCVKDLAEAYVGPEACGAGHECCVVESSWDSSIALGTPAARHIAIDPTELAGMESPYLALLAQGRVEDCGNGLNEVSYAGIVYTVAVSNEPSTEFPSSSATIHTLDTTFTLGVLLFTGCQKLP